MSKLSDSADALLSWAEKHKAVVELAETVKGLGSIEEATVERKAALKSATAEHEDMADKVASAKVELAKTMAMIVSAKADHWSAVAQSEASTRQQCETLLRKAQAEAAEMVETAKRDVAAIRAEHDQTIAGLKADIQAKRGELEDTQEAVSGAKAEHDAVKTKTEALKEAAKSILA